MYINTILPIFVLLLSGGIIAGVIYLFVSIIRCFSDSKQLKSEQNRLLSQITQELEKLNQK